MMALLMQSGKVLHEGADVRALIKPLADVQRAAIESAMILCEGNIDEARKRLKISRATLYRRLKEYAD